MQRQTGSRSSAGDVSIARLPHTSHIATAILIEVVHTHGEKTRWPTVRDVLGWGNVRDDIQYLADGLSELVEHDLVSFRKGATDRHEDMIVSVPDSVNAFVIGILLSRSRSRVSRALMNFEFTSLDFAPIVSAFEGEFSPVTNEPDSSASGMIPEPRDASPDTSARTRHAASTHRESAKSAWSKSANDGSSK